MCTRLSTPYLLVYSPLRSSLGTLLRLGVCTDRDTVSLLCINGEIIMTMHLTTVRHAAPAMPALFVGDDVRPVASVAYGPTAFHRKAHYASGMVEVRKVTRTKRMLHIVMMYGS
jgi:hypothetical protein